MWLTQAQDIFTVYSTAYYTSVLKKAVANESLNGTSFVRDAICQFTKKVNSTTIVHIYIPIVFIFANIYTCKLF